MATSFRRLCAVTIAAAILAGCASSTTRKPLSQAQLAQLQPVALSLSVPQPQVYAKYEISSAGTTGAVACGVVPGIGILLAAACGGVAGAMDASINASRAEEADVRMRPLKDTLIGLRTERDLQDNIAAALAQVQGMKLAGVTLTREPLQESYFRKVLAATNTGTAMFIEVDYHLVQDMSRLEMRSRSLIYPRSSGASSTQAQMIGAPVGTPGAGAASRPFDPENAAYRFELVYRAALPSAGTDAAQNARAWSADQGALLRLALQDGVRQTSALLAQDLQGLATAAAQTGSSQRARSGALEFNADLAKLSAAEAPSALSTDMPATPRAQ